jgi:hypothetical protein
LGPTSGDEIADNLRALPIPITTAEIRAALPLSSRAYPDFLFAALERAACAVFCKENRMKIATSPSSTGNPGQPRDLRCAFTPAQLRREATNLRLCPSLITTAEVRAALPLSSRAKPRDLRCAFTPSQLEREATNLRLCPSLITTAEVRAALQFVIPRNRLAFGKLRVK